MKQYIDKCDIVAEINRRKKELIELSNESNRFVNQWACGLLDNILSFIDTIEVKEVDLEKDVDEILEENDWNYDKIDFYDFAKYFFELGLKVQKRK